ncbi:mandelate racemase/muconate lactonizing protein [Caballeronia hypogeia]|uniref:Mandelate racemase/muconate lactonizing protein n=1 Tax=Caballeronia hypogeia TaxID=1777140 RepID=A0A158ADQ0_9BURK|nr:mandelate racemase/muconate lactonizing enzyme family protein [Caballeronia hypogeia]SAK55972.1 mandelate racemase/muconate lactonizing protein [Caballeronia hypogeia]
MSESGSRIRSVEVIPVGLRYTHDGPPTGFGGAQWTTLRYALVKVCTDDGLVGWGEAFGYNVLSATVQVIRDTLAPLAVGRDAADIAGLMGSLKHTLHLFGRGGPTQYALGGLDIALWDLAGKRAGTSVAALLGGMRRREIPAYSSLMRMPDPAGVARACEKVLARGFTQVKLHEHTVEAVAAARGAIGEDAELMLDVNCAWTPGEAERIVEQLVPYRLKWVEEPIYPPEDFEALARLRQRVPVPLAAGENLANAWSFKAAIASGALDFLQPSVTKTGGISELRTILTMAEMHGCAVAPHSPYFGPGLLATLQLAAHSPLIGQIESFGVRLETPLFGPVGLPDARGVIHLPDGPGLGADPDPEVIEACRIA